jgi:hypothetical protein
VNTDRIGMIIDFALRGVHYEEYSVAYRIARPVGPIEVVFRKNTSNWMI